MQRILFFLVLLTIPTLPEISPAADPKLPNTAALKKIGQRMDAFVEGQQVSGVVTLVAHRGKVVHLKAVGLADMAQQRPMQTDSLFCIASMTKPMTATAVMILCDEGKLSIDDPVSKYLPDFADIELRSGPPARPLTIGDLMTHTSGVSGNQQNQGTLEATVQQFSKRTLKFHPGTQWAYSPGLSICGRIIEIVSGHPYEKFLQQRIFDPLQMTDTTFSPNTEQQTRIVTLYKPSKDKSALVTEPNWWCNLNTGRSPNPSGGLFSTAKDVARFYQMVLDGGQYGNVRIVSEKSVREMTTVQTGELEAGFTPGCGWGYGWGVVRNPQGVTRMLSPGTFGHGGAFGTQGWADPDRQSIYVLMIQRTGFGNGDASDIRAGFQDLAAKAVDGTN